MKLTSTTTTTTVSTRKVYSMGNIRVTEVYANGRLTGQSITTKAPKQSHHLAYEPSSLYFLYYKDLSFLEDKDLARTHRTIPEPTNVDPTTFSTKDLKNVLAIHLGMDGNIYSIENTYPVPMWRYSDYISGFSSGRYDLNKVKAKLETIPWVKEVKIIDIPYYNADSCGRQAVEFYYKVPQAKMKKICDAFKGWKNDHAGHMGILRGIDLFGMKKFQLPERKED